MSQHELHEGDLVQPRAGRIVVDLTAQAAQVQSGPLQRILIHADAHGMGTDQPERDVGRDVRIGWDGLLAERDRAPPVPAAVLVLQAQQFVHTAVHVRRDALGQLRIVQARPLDRLVDLQVGQEVGEDSLSTGDIGDFHRLQRG